MKKLFNTYAPNLKYIASIGFSYSNLRHWKNGRAVPNPITIYKLAFVLAALNNKSHDKMILEAIHEIKGGKK